MVSMLQIEHVPIDCLKPAPYNPRRITAGQMAMLQKSLTEFGFVDPIIANQRTGRIVGGHQRWEAAKRMGIETVPVAWVDLDRDREKALNIALNQHGGDWDYQKLPALLVEIQDIGLDLEAIGFTADDLDEMLAEILPTDEEPKASKDDEGREPEPVPPPSEPVAMPGEVWQLGRHRVICGDCTQPDVVRQLLDGVSPDVLLTDPPYCSGGNQEAQKAGGSIGTRGDERVANDNLSTRGYVALMRAMLSNIKASVAYVFCDWRMWPHLTETAELSGYPVKNMVVWDKTAMGMGVGWRSQHELIMVASPLVKSPFSRHTALGNVVPCPRSGNEHHPTEKPVTLLKKILGVTPKAATVIDPFLGSGSTLLACEELGLTCYGIELTPGHVDTVIARWEKATGETAVCLGTAEG